MVVDEAVGDDSDSVGTPLVVYIEMDVPAMSCEAADVVTATLPVVLGVVPEVVLATGGNEVERATVLRMGFCVPVDAVAYGAIVTVSLKIAHISATEAMVAGCLISRILPCALYLSMLTVIVCLVACTLRAVAHTLQVLFIAAQTTPLGLRASGAADVCDTGKLLFVSDLFCNTRARDILHNPGLRPH